MAIGLPRVEQPASSKDRQLPDDSLTLYISQHKDHWVYSSHEDQRQHMQAECNTNNRPSKARLLSIAIFLVCRSIHNEAIEIHDSNTRKSRGLHVHRLAKHISKNATSTRILLNHEASDLDHRNFHQNPASLVRCVETVIDRNDLYNELLRYVDLAAHYPNLQTLRIHVPESTVKRLHAQYSEAREEHRKAFEDGLCNQDHDPEKLMVREVQQLLRYRGVQLQENFEIELLVKDEPGSQDPEDVEPEFEHMTLLERLAWLAQYQRNKGTYQLWAIRLQAMMNVTVGLASSISRSPRPQTDGEPSAT